jgi:hypothetical protein
MTNDQIPMTAALLVARSGHLDLVIFSIGHSPEALWTAPS